MDHGHLEPLFTASIAGRAVLVGASILLAGCGDDGSSQPELASRGYLGSVSIEIPGNDWSSYRRSCAATE